MTKFNRFTYQNNKLYCENCSVEEIAEKQGTPFYLYSYHAIVDQFQKMTSAFKGQDHLICFSAKANPNQAILRTLINQGSGVDVVSGGELRRALNAACDPQKIVYSGVGKTSEEIHLALQSKILQLNCESEQELDNIQRIASFHDIKAPVAIRVNPNVDPKTHPYISTGLKKNKFGVSHKRAFELYQRAKNMSHVDLVGISCHIGSQILTTEPFHNAMLKVAELVKELFANGIRIQNIDVGGGLGIVYKDEQPESVENYAAAIMGPLKDFGCRILLEPGRFIIGNAGCLITKVIYLKQGEDEHHFTIVDAAFNDLKRPMIYDAYHEILPVKQRSERKEIITNIEGPICETTDRFARDRKIQLTEPGEFLSIMSAGAYGISMASTYNSRPRPAELLVKDGDFYVIKKPDRLEDITGKEALPNFLKS